MRPGAGPGCDLPGAALSADPSVLRRFAILRRLEGQLHRGFARGSQRHDLGAFLLYLWPRPEPFYRTRALPTVRPESWRAAVERLVAGFAAIGREPRLEFFAELWPGLAQALEAAGFEREMAAPVLVLDRPPPGTPAGLTEILPADAPEAPVAAFLHEVQAAFGIPSVTHTAEVEVFRRDLAEGATLAAARFVDGRPVAGACLIGLGAEAELAGVWTVAAQRRRGLATEVCATLLRRFFKGGGELVWLSAADAAGERLYRRLGFLPVGTQLNYALPAAR